MKIAPCPNCKTDSHVAVYAYESGWKHVECDKCFYLGPGKGKIAQAIESHNARVQAEQLTNSLAHRGGK
jgi:Zn ribbon nucleic-acid-binding protein